MQDLSPIFEILQASPSRQRFKLKTEEILTLQEKGIDRILDQAWQMLERQLKPASPLHEGHQAPSRGEPVTIARHATALCCRKCMLRWHQIPRGRELSYVEMNYAMSVLREWFYLQEFKLPKRVLPKKDPQLRLF